MALSGLSEKTGKASFRPYGARFSFSRLFRPITISYADPPMSKLQRPTTFVVIWETVPDPDPHALLKAVAMLFHRGIPLSTGADLTARDEELLCRRPPES